MQNIEIEQNLQAYQERKNHLNDSYLISQKHIELDNPEHRIPNCIKIVRKFASIAS